MNKYKDSNIDEGLELINKDGFRKIKKFLINIF